MKHWVVDTNVVVSGLLSPSGFPARILDAVVDGRVKLVHDARILAEYRDVLNRPKFKLRPESVQAFLEGLRGQMLVTPVRASVGLPDPDDAIFVEAALPTAEPTIVTGNLSHYPVEVLQGVRVITPAQASAELDSEV